MKIASLTKVMIALFFVIGAINAVSLYRSESYNRGLLQTAQTQAIYKQLGIDLMSASDLLSEQARCYVQNGDPVYYDAYMYEVNHTRTRESVIEWLIELGAPQNEIDLVTQAALCSSTLELLEMEAFEAVANGDLDRARQLMFSEAYAERKQAIINAMNDYQGAVDERLKNEAQQINGAASEAFVVRVVLNTFLLVSVIASLFIILRYISKDQKLRAEHEARQLALEAELRETALSAHEALSRLSAIYSSIPDTLFCKDVDGLYTSCNRSFEMQAGMMESEIIGKTYEEVFGERATDAAELYRSIDQKVMSEYTIDVLEEVIVYPDGSRKVMETLKAPLIQNDTVVGVLGIGRDTTQYGEVKNRLERIINTVQVAFLMSVNGRIVEANEYSKTTLGVKPGDSILSIYAEPGQRAALLKMLEGKTTAANAVKFNMLGGEVHRFFVNISVAKYENQQAYILWGLDIEQDEVKNDQIRVTQQSLQTVLDALPIPVRIVDLETNDIVYVNNSFLELLEYSSPDEMHGRKISDILPESSGDGTLSADLIHKTLRSENLISFEVDYKTKFGNVIETLLSTRHIEYKGRRSSIGIIKDLRAEKEHTQMLMNTAEREKEANQAKSLFLANMSHEIRTPLNGIIGFSELALDDHITVESKNDYLRKIKSSGAGLLQIINDILDISKIEAGKIELEIIPFNIHETFRICQSIIMPKALEKGIALYCYAEPSVGKRLLGDPTRLRQVLLNLLSNAVKFTNVGTVKLLSSVIAKTDDSVTMNFEVKDSGIGMTPEQIDKIFEAFTQADATTTRKYGGTGLGLSITKNIIEMMGGELAVKSEPSIGSKFSFELTFPTTDIEEGGEDPGIVLSELQRPTFNGEALLFEDNETNQQVVCDHLSRVGIRAVIAANGQIGVELVQGRMERGEKPFDLIFMDIHMPVMDGLEASKKLDEMGNRTPVIALTANVMTTSREIYREHGMPDYLAKPFQAQELWACLLKYLTPVDFTLVNTAEERDADQRQQRQVELNFVKDHQGTFAEIAGAIEQGDLALAHRLAHTLKGLAGMMDGAELQKAARAVEMPLSDGITPTAEQMDTLRRAMDAMLDRLAPLLEQGTAAPAKALAKEDAVALLDRLEPLLVASNTECMDLVDPLGGIPGAETLIEYIETFEFQKAYEAVVELQKNL